MVSLAVASADWMPIKDASPCKKAGSLSTISVPYVAQITQMNADREKAEKEAAKAAGNSGFVPSAPPGGIRLPPGVPNQTGLVPQWKPGQTWQPGQTAFKPTPGQTPASPSTPIPGTPVGAKGFPRPVGCGHH